ncbi:hypothetical protein PSEUDO9AG_40117 [Pseudomonas sp. 9Ag]|nr:hypothetical protein PSEUDO9AG_40117 [Pseudomonas sp. 9Ag]
MLGIDDPKAGDLDHSKRALRDGLERLHLKRQFNQRDLKSPLKMATLQTDRHASGIGSYRK